MKTGEPDSQAVIRQAASLRAKGQADKAIAPLRALVSAEPGNAEAAHMLGLCHIATKNLQAARRAIARALELAPDNPAYHHNLAGVLSSLGRIHEAEGHFREALRLRPDYAEAFYNMSGNVRLRHPDPLLDQVEALLETDLGRRDRCFAHFAAGKFCNDLKDYDRAFAHYREGNAAKGAVHDPAEIDAFGAALEQVFTAEFLVPRNAAAAETGGRVVFIVGMPRSGTSLTEQILASHPEVFGAGELPDIKAISEAVGRYVEGAPAYPVSARDAGAPVFQGLARSYLQRLDTLAPGAARVTDKMPLDFWHLGLIACLFRDPVILHCTRDPLDTCLSCFFQNFQSGQEYSFDLGHLGHFYRAYRRIMAHWRRVLPVPIVDVSYEALVADPEAEATKALTAMGLGWHSDCAAAHRTARTVQTASRWQVRQPVYQSSAGRWRRYAAHLGPLREALWDVVDD